MYSQFIILTLVFSSNVFEEQNHNNQNLIATRQEEQLKVETRSNTSAIGSNKRKVVTIYSRGGSKIMKREQVFEDEYLLSTSYFIFNSKAESIFVWVAVPATSYYYGKSPRASSVDHSVSMVDVDHDGKIDFIVVKEGTQIEFFRVFSPTKLRPISESQYRMINENGEEELEKIISNDE